MTRKLFIALLISLLLCGSLAAAELPADLTVIGDEAFVGDEALCGVVTLPEAVTAVGSRAFAATGLHALIVPENCESLAADVLADAEAAYVTLSGAQTAVNGEALSDVPFVFGPEGGSASRLTGFYALETLYVQDNFYYSLTEDEAIPLCAVTPVETGDVVLPKLVDGIPLRQLDALVLRGCEGAVVSVPSYLTIPEGMTVATYNAMSLTTPVVSVTECMVGDEITITTEVAGAYGDVSYIWYFDTDGTIASSITAEPTITWSPTMAGSCVVSVTAVDALNDRITAQAEAVTVSAPVPVYRALLIGNTYAGTDSELEGTDTDARAMASMLRSMTATPYRITTQFELNATAIQSAIASTFADARPCDVSLFFFSGHGTNAGSLVGTGNSFVSVSALRSWLDAIPGTKIVIIDCCHSGMMIGKSEGGSDLAAFTSAFISGFSYYNKDYNLATNGYLVMTACSQSQLSQSLSDGTISFGAFTYGLCYGCGYDEWNQTALSSMPADANGDGFITLGEAYAGALERVSWLAEMIPELDQVAQYYGEQDFVLWGR